MELDVPLIGVSQLNRKVEGRVDKRPIMSDLRESGTLEQDADIIILVYRPDYNDSVQNNGPVVSESELIVAKQRNGPQGVVRAMFHKGYSAFINPTSRITTEWNV